MNAEAVARQLIEWLRAEVSAAGARGVVLGLSGGIDSAVVAGLARQAFPDTHLALILPIDSDPADSEDARAVVDSFRLHSKSVDLTAAYDGLAGALGPSPANDSSEPDLAAANVKARLRMIALYYHANRFRYLVAGTGNRSEMSLGYFTKHGDGGVDLLPLGHLVKSEVAEMARLLEVPERIIAKPPSAGLWRGSTDESELGFTYQQLEEYLMGGLDDEDLRQRIETRRRANAHKLRTPKLPPSPSAAVS